jgi:hypothetical protein
MRNTIKLIGIIALVAIIGFGAVSCKEDADDTSEKSITITSIPPQYTGEVVLGLYTSKADAGKSFPAVGGTEITASGSVVTFRLWDNSKEGVIWTGTGDYYLFFKATPAGSNDSYVTKTKQKISKENTTIAFSGFEKL